MRIVKIGLKNYFLADLIYFLLTSTTRIHFPVTIIDLNHKFFLLTCFKEIAESFIFKTLLWCTKRVWGLILLLFNAYFENLMLFAVINIISKLTRYHFFKILLYYLSPLFISIFGDFRIHRNKSNIEISIQDGHINCCWSSLSNINSNYRRN